MIKHNVNNTIFEPEALESFEKYSGEISKSGFSIQIYTNAELVAHASVAKIKDPIFGNSEIYVLLRLIVDEEYRKLGIQEYLVKEISSRIPCGSPFCLQVFPKNEAALKFFLRKMNVHIAFEKWVVK